MRANYETWSLSGRGKFTHRLATRADIPEIVALMRGVDCRET